MNESNKYNVVFKGEIISSNNEIIEDIKNKIIQILKIPEKQVYRFFSGEKITLKSDIDFEEATILQKKLEKIRLKTYIIEQVSIENTLSEDDIDSIKGNVVPAVNFPLLKYFSYKGKKQEKKVVLFDRKQFAIRLIISLLIIILLIISTREVSLLSTIIILPKFIVTNGILTIFVFVPTEFSLVILVILYYMTRCSVRRLNDIGLTGWLSIVLYIPLINILLIIVLLTVPRINLKTE